MPLDSGLVAPNIRFRIRPLLLLRSFRAASKSHDYIYLSSHPCRRWRRFMKRGKPNDLLR